MEKNNSEKNFPVVDYVIYKDGKQVAVVETKGKKDKEISEKIIAEYAKKNFKS